MAVSPSHQFGQIIGDVLEAAVLPLLQRFARKHGLYLDKKGERPCRSGRKCSWIDANKNVHDLDFVLERGGTADKQGLPVAFIETAWRRYTKHSRNKAQEIQGAIIPLAETYRHTAPFKGAILAGVFTAGAISQLVSLGFTVLHYPYETIVRVFRKFGVEAAFDEDTTDQVFHRKVRDFKQLTADKRASLARQLLNSKSKEVTQFLHILEATVARLVERILIIPLYGDAVEVATLDEAIHVIQSANQIAGSKSFQRYEIHVRYNNGNVIEGRFKDKESAIQFLAGFKAAP